MKAYLAFVVAAVLCGVQAIPAEISLLERMEKMENTVANLMSSSLARNKRAFVESGVSFSAVLDDALFNIVIGQTIVFNKVFLNEGNAYNAQNGEFTVPMDGVYLFSYFVAEINNDQIVLRLVVNGENRVDAVAEGLQDRHNDQGGNLVILRLHAGDTVLIQAYDTSNVHIDGGANYWYTSFSGVLLYA
ncbi:complement C1q-like protein 4 [Ruditapes philippinarum]|uniref:complement C1q-like protein 4 n=1 Tax=Ruditapes philippinarum TaxID=129788 RepID=UPI00295A7647|nr:complement C1q-like protein 4 [Ruditapes philippinarum]